MNHSIHTMVASSKRCVGNSFSPYMVTQGPPAPVPTSLLRSNSGLTSAQGGGMPSQNMFPSLVSPHNQFNNTNMLGDVPNMSSLLHQSFGNNGLSVSGLAQQGLMDGGPEPDPPSGIGTWLGSNPPPSSYTVSSIPGGNPNRFGQDHGQPSTQMLTDQQQSQLLDGQQLFSMPGNSHQPQQSQGMIPNSGPVELEPQANGVNQTPHALRNLGRMKLDTQQLPIMRNNVGPVKIEPQHQQQFVISRQSPQTAAAAHLLHHQRLMQMQHQKQQEESLRATQQQRSPVQPQFNAQNSSTRAPVKPIYETGMCARRLTHYMYQQQHRPEGNSIEFWRDFTTEYFAPNAKKKWCISMYESGRQTTGVLPQDIWQCEICNRKPGRGFEATADVLPRLFKVKYESGTLEELLYVDLPQEHQNSSGNIVLDYAKAIQESVFEQLRVVREGQLRIVFSPDLKICSWEFCARKHEELIPRRLLIPQVSQLGAAAQKWQADAQNSSSGDNSVSELQNNCNAFLASCRQLAKALEVPLVNDFGYTKRYVRCLQISEVVNTMKDLIDYSSETGTGPTESLTQFPRSKNPSSEVQGQTQQPEAQQQLQQPQASIQSFNHEIPAQASNPQLSMTNVNSTVNSAPMTSSRAVVGLLHQNSMNSHQPNPSSGPSPYAGYNIQMGPPGSSSMVPRAQPTAQSSVNNGQPTPHNNLSGNHINSPSGSMHHPALSGDNANDPQSSVQKIINEMMISSHLSNNNINSGGGGGMMGAKTVNGMRSVNDGPHMLLGNNGAAHCNNPGFGGTMGRGGVGQSIMVNGSRANVLNNNSLPMNGGPGTSVANQHQQHHSSNSNQLLSGGLGAVNVFDDLPFDWK